MGMVLFLSSNLTRDTLVGVKPRVLWRLVYLVRMVADCDCSWLFWLMLGTQAAAWSTGVRIPIAE